MLRAFFIFIFVLGILKAQQSDDSSKIYRLDLDLSYVTLSRNISGSDNVVDAKVNPVMNLSLGLTLFPSEYDIKLGYSKNLISNVNDNLYNPYNYNDDTESYYFSAIPYYNSTYGGFGLFYTYASQNSKYTNRLTSTMMIGKYDIDLTQPSGMNLVKQFQSIQPGQSFQFQEEVSYLGIKYLLPEYEYLPKGVNIFYSQMDRTSLYYGSLGVKNYLIYKSAKGDMYGFGLQRELHELTNKELSLDLLQISRGKFENFPDIKLQEYTVGATYKHDQFFVKLFALMYIAQEYNSQLNNNPLRIKKVTDLMSTIHLGMSF